MRPSFRHMWLEREGGGFDTINQCLVEPWVQQLANKSWELFASWVDTQMGSESLSGICWTLVWENYDSHVGWDIKQPRWEAKLMRLFSQELNIFSWGLEYLDDSQPLIFATTQTFAQSKSDRRHQGSLQRSTHCCQHREIWWGRVFEVWTLPASVPHVKSDQLIGVVAVNFCIKRRWQKTLQTFTRARCSLKIFVLATDTIHIQG